MSDIFKRITNVELRLQWSGDWDPFYNGSNDGFPGLEVPMELARRLQSMKGMVLKVDNDYYKASVEAEVRKLIESVISTEGPANARWVPLASASWTSSSHIRWVGAGAQSIAFEIGTQVLSATGQIEDGNPKNPFNDAYAFSATRTGNAKYWICVSFNP